MYKSVISNWIQHHKNIVHLLFKLALHQLTERSHANTKQLNLSQHFDLLKLPWPLYTDQPHSHCSQWKILQHTWTTWSTYNQLSNTTLLIQNSDYIHRRQDRAQQTKYRLTVDTMNTENTELTETQNGDNNWWWQSTERTALNQTFSAIKPN